MGEATDEQWADVAFSIFSWGTPIEAAGHLPLSISNVLNPNSRGRFFLLHTY